MKLKSAAVICILWATTACTQVPEWTLFYYPERQELPQTVVNSEAISGYYQTLQQCRTKAEGMRRISQSGVAAFQCGHHCQTDKTGKLVCKSME